MSNEDTGLPALMYDPSYSLSDADLVLASSDGVFFRVHSTVMRLASGVFQGMLEVNRDNDTRECAEEPIQLTESAPILKSLLDLVYPNASLSNRDVSSVEFLQELCRAAEKYEMSGATQCVKALFFTPIRTFPSLQTYSIACKYGWEEEARVASTATLEHSLSSKESLEIMKSMDTLAILKLQAFHRLRKETLLSAFDNIHFPLPRFGVPSTGPGLLAADLHLSNGNCTKWSVRMNDPSIVLLRFYLGEEMEKRPSGDTIRAPQFWDRTELHTIWLTRCGCGSPQLNKARIMAGVLRILDSLPRTI